MKSFKERNIPPMRGEMMHFSENSIRKLIRTSVHSRFRISKTAIQVLGTILSEDGTAITKVASEIAGTNNRTIILEEDILEAYYALFL